MHYEVKKITGVYNIAVNDHPTGFDRRKESLIKKVSAQDTVSISSEARDRYAAEDETIEAPAEADTPDSAK